MCRFNHCCGIGCVHCTEDRPIVIASPETFGLKTGSAANGLRRTRLGGDENPNCEDGSGVKYACLPLSQVSSPINPALNRDSIPDENCHCRFLLLTCKWPLFSGSSCD